MGRCTVIKGLQEETEPALGLLLGKAQGSKHLLLHLSAVDADAATAQLSPVEHQIIGLGPGLDWICVQKMLILRQRCCKGMVGCLPSAFSLVVLKQRPVDHPQQIPSVTVDEPQLFPKIEPQPPQNLGTNLVLICNENQQIPGFGLHGLHQASQLLGTKELGDAPSAAFLSDNQPQQSLGAIG